MLHGFLADKSKTSYIKFFSMIAWALDDKNFRPDSMSTDFEMGAINGFIEVFQMNISNMTGCFFHLSQILWRYVVEYGLKNFYTHHDKMRKCYRLTQALAFVTENDVIRGLNYIEKYYLSKCPKHEPIIKNLKKTI